MPGKASGKRVAIGRSGRALKVFRTKECPAQTDIIVPAPSAAKLSEVVREQETRKKFPPLPACATGNGGRRAKSFLLVYMGHSGSSAIISELAAHSQVFFESAEPVDHYEYEKNTTLALEWTRAYFARGVAAGRTPGFKVRPYHIMKDPAAWAQLVREFDTRVIWQYRDNIFKQSVGEYTYQKLKDSSVVEGLRKDIPWKERCRFGAGCRFKIQDMDFFYRSLRMSVRSDSHISEAVRFLDGSRNCILRLPYEDYLHYRKDAVSRLYRFLGMKQEDHKPDRFKATSDNLCETLENWDQVCESFYGCLTWRTQMDDPRHNCWCKANIATTKYCKVDVWENI